MLLFAALATAVIATLACFWKGLRNWLLNVAKKLKDIIRGILYGCKTFIKAFLEKGKTIFEEISKNYSKNGEQWEITTATRKVDPSEVPDDILERAFVEENNEVDITQDFEMELGLTA